MDQKVVDFRKVDDQVVDLRKVDEQVVSRAAGEGNRPALRVDCHLFGVEGLRFGV